MSRSRNADRASAAEFPEATVRRDTFNLQRLAASGFWLLTAACLVVVIVLLATTYYSAGTRVTVHFDQGHGLQPGDFVRYRGINVGEVESVALNRTATGVDVTIQFEPEASSLAREGARFWIARPQVSLAGVRGLETVVGAKYVGVLLDGPPDAPSQYVFEGDSEPPSEIEREPGGLEVVLESEERHGVEAGAPITYRGLPVGHVVAVQLASDAAQVEARAYIRPGYRALVRENTVFWSTGGIDLNIGLRGFELNAETLSTIAAGGVALATPEPPGQPAAVGARFTLVTEPQNWTDWQPQLPIGFTWLVPGDKLPQPTRASLLWQERLLGITRNQQATGWVVAIEGGRLLGPASVVAPPAGALEGSSRIELLGQEFPLAKNNVRQASGLGLATVSVPTPTPLADAWPMTKIRAVTEPEPCLLVAGDNSDVVPLTANRLIAAEGSWQIDPAVTLPANAHGAAVVAARDGGLIGIALVASGPPRVAFVTDVLGAPEPGAE